MKAQLKKSKKDFEIVNLSSSKGQPTKHRNCFEIVNLSSSKGQLTIFMLLGVVILVSFGLLFFAVSVSQEAKLKQESERVLASFIETYAIKSYVESCLDITGSNALLQVGSQSRLYTEQGGTTSLGKHIEIEHNNITANVSYGILRTSSNYTYFQNDTGFKLPVPDYPIPERTFEELNDDLTWEPRKLFYDGHYGGVFLPSLCNLTGLNSPETESILYSAGTCMPTTYDFIQEMKGKSFQDELGKAVSSKLRNCVNISYLASSFGYNISDADPSVKIAYLPSSTKFIAEYPLTIRLRGGKPVTQVYSFEKSLPVRLMKIYNLAFYLTKQDSRELFFDRSKTNYEYCTDFFRPEFCWDSSIDVNREQLDYDYVVRITDYNSLIGGEPYFFQYLVENRIPVLNWIESPITRLENDTVELKPEGKDPDLENVGYVFKGWKETYDSWLDEECALVEKANNLMITFRELVEECTYYDYDIIPRNWSGNLKFIGGKWVTSYETNRSDIGIHNLTVEVVDDSGNIDYQLLEIWIYDLAKAIIKGNNEYGLNENMTSIEDKYYLDGSESVSFALAISGYNWSGYTTGFNPYELFSVNTSNPYFVIPDNITENEEDIQNIDSKIFITTGVYNLSLRVGTLEQWGEPAYLEVNVTECLPYSSNAPAYPFNNLQTVLFPGLTGYSSELNPFFADHACCGADYEFLGVGTTCFDYSEYGPVNKLTDQQLNKLDLLGPYNRQLVSIGVDQENDIYSRTFEKKCSEDRGNICSGQGEDVFTLTSCGDDNLGVDDQTERCQGPDNTNIRNTPLNCIDYGSGESFETFFSLGGDGICNEVFRQSNPDDVYDSTGPYSCQAECGSGSCSSPVNCECDNNNECDGLTYEELLLGDISLNECIVGNTFTSCNTGCEYVSDNVCVRDFSKDCFAHLDCDGITQGSAINSYEYCDSNCQLRDCGNYAVNQGLNPAECYTSCWNNNDAKCAPGYHCVVAICVEDSP